MMLEIVREKTEAMPFDCPMALYSIFSTGIGKNLTIVFAYYL